MITEADRINAALTDEARDGLRTIISLDGFLALKGEARAARWRGLDHGAKFQLVAQAVTRQTGRDWTHAEVASGIAHYDEQYRIGPLDAAIEGALERLALDNAQHAETADKSDRAYFRRAATSYTNALIQYRAGVRPARLASGAYLLPSRRAGEAPHIVTMDGDWTCSCKAQSSMHWPLALVIGIEVAHDDMQRFDDPLPEPTPTELGQRLADARRRLYAEAA